MEINDKKFIELSPELYNRCLEYMKGRGLGEKTKMVYTKELDNIFKNTTLTQSIYNRIYSKRGYYGSILKLITDTCKHFDIPSYKYKAIKMIKQPRKRPQVWSEYDINRMIENVEDYGLLISCAYNIGAGLRFSSAIMLSWDDFNWEDWIHNKSRVGKCKVTAKGAKHKDLIVDSRLMNLLHSIAKGRGKTFQDIPYKNSVENKYLFIKKVELDALQSEFRDKNFQKILDSSGGQINATEMAKIEMIRKKHYMVDYRLRKLSKMFNNKRIKFHSIRNSKATSLLKKGFKPITIRNQLMHNSISTTEIYLNLTDIDEENEFQEKL